MDENGWTQLSPADLCLIVYNNWCKLCTKNMTEGSKLKIVVADDSKMWRAVLKDFLNSEGYDVVMANDGLEAYFKIHEEIPNVVISDVVMPGLNGYQLCRLLRNDPNFSSIPILLLTASSESLNKFWSKYSGANAYIQKDSKDGLKQISLKLREMGKTLGLEQKPNPINGKRAFGDTLDKLFAEISLRGEVRKLFNHVEDMNYTIRRINDLMRDLFEIKAMALLSITLNEMALYSSVTDFEFLEGWMISQLVKPSFPQKKRYIRIDGETETKGFAQISKVMSFDLKEQGVITIWRDRTFSNREIGSFSIISEELGGVLKIGVQLEEYRRNANFDDLTGLANYRALEGELRKLWDDGKNFVLSIMDIDHFKKVNDTYGHAIGNEVLSSIGKILRDFAKDFNFFAARFGGEEFIVISEKKENFFEIVDNIRTKIEKARLSKSVPELIVTISAGIAERNGFNSFTEVVEMADQALYKAKERGRNKVLNYEAK